VRDPVREDELVIWIVVMLALLAVIEIANLGVRAYIWWQHFRVRRSERALNDAWRAYEETRR
jgi:uncharacterized protein HemY